MQSRSQPFEAVAAKAGRDQSDILQEVCTLLTSQLMCPTISPESQHRAHGPLSHPVIQNQDKSLVVRH